MQVKKFEAPTMQEALKVIKRELGPEAIILSTKHLKSGFGLMSKASVEVTAAIAEKDLKKKTMAEKNLPNEVKEKIWNSKATKQAEIYNDYFEKQLKSASKDRVELSAAKRRVQQEESPLFNRKPAQAQTPRTSAKIQLGQSGVSRAAPVASAPKADLVAAQVSSRPAEKRYIDISDDDDFSVAKNQRSISSNDSSLAAPEASSDNRVKHLEADIEQLKSMLVELASTNNNSADEAGQGGDDATQLGAIQDLVASGIEKKLAREIVRKANFDLPEQFHADEKALLDKVAEQFLDEIKVFDLLENVGAKAGKSTSTVISLVGPTGVGKTTTIAKIASLAILERNLRVGLINLDSYKVAAADQLATYAKIMNLPFRSVNSKEELQQAIFDFSSLDMVLIDTTGRSQKDQESLIQLRHMLAGIEGARSVLLMSATTKDTDMNEVVARFKIFNPMGLVFSKLDETSVYGCIYNTQKKTGLPLLYFTVGQRVPEDIEKASAERVVDLVLDL